MTEEDRITQAASANGWTLRVDLLSGRTHHYAKGGKIVVAKFDADGTCTEATVDGHKVGRSKAANVIQYLRGK